MVGELVADRVEIVGDDPEGDSAAEVHQAGDGRLRRGLAA